MPNTREKINCRDCPYRKFLAGAFDIHVWEEDCDRYGTEYCWDHSETKQPPKGE